MKIGITGGSGFIGQYIVESLEQRTDLDLIRIIDIKRPEFSGNFEYINGDIRDEDKVEEFCQNLDWIIHLAAEHHDFGVNEEEYFDVNENGTQKILDVMTKQGVNNILFYSSVAVYGTADLPANEKSHTNPESAYGASKLAAERKIILWLENNKARTAFIIRPTVVIGARNLANMYFLIDQIFRGRYKFHFGHGENVKSLAFVRSLVDFTLKLIFQYQEPENQHAIYNYVNNPQLTIARTIEIIHAELGIKEPKVRIPLSPALFIGKIFDIAILISGQNLPISSARIKKISMTTHFESLEINKIQEIDNNVTIDGLKEMVKWYLNEKA